MGGLYDCPFIMQKKERKPMDITSIISSLISAAVVLTGYIIVDRREKNEALGFTRFYSM